MIILNILKVYRYYSIYGTILYEGMWTYDPVVSEF
jgi:hypothetical protein